MYSNLLIAHSFVRWLVVVLLIVSIVRAYLGYSRKSPFTKRDNALRHWTATSAHIQLVIGILLYIKSPLIQYFWANFGEAKSQPEMLFFGMIHFALMLTAVIIVTIGSAMAKRKVTDRARFLTMLGWFGFAFILIFIAIPWPFSPLANRPFFRPF